MTYTPTQTLTFDEFIAQYGDNFRYELADGELIDRSLTEPHEAVGGKLQPKLASRSPNTSTPGLSLVPV